MKRPYGFPRLDASCFPPSRWFSPKAVFLHSPRKGLANSESLFCLEWSYKFLIAVFFLLAANKIAAFPKYGETTINGLPNMGDEIEPKHSREIPWCVLRWDLDVLALYEAFSQRIRPQSEVFRPFWKLRIVHVTIKRNQPQSSNKMRFSPPESYVFIPVPRYAVYFLFFFSLGKSLLIISGFSVVPLIFWCNTMVGSTLAFVSLADIKQIIFKRCWWFWLKDFVFLLQSQSFLMHFLGKNTFFLLHIISRRNSMQNRRRFSVMFSFCLFCFSWLQLLWVLNVLVLHLLIQG